MNTPKIKNVDRFYNLWKDKNSRVSENDEMVFKNSGNSAVYGYLTPQGFQVLLDHYIEHDTHHKGPKIFYDIGSGLGMPNILAVFLIPKLQASYGIELSTARYNIAQSVLDKLPSALRQKVNFLNTDMLLYKQYKHADMIWTSNLCFPEQITEQLVGVLNKQLKPHTQVFSSKPLSNLNHSFHELFTVEQSWSKHSNIHHYII